MSSDTAIMLILAIAAALLSAALLPKPIESGASQRCSALDGLRGYLAFFVVLHHSAYWFHYLRTGV